VRFVVAIDGPAAAGKGTIAKAVAARFGLAHLDTGALYRATAARVLSAGGDPADAEAAAAAARALEPADLSRPGLRSAAVSEGASLVAAVPCVRAALLDFQRRFAAREGGAVLDGRDIGTVVCPDADVKLYVTASAEVRAGRRLRDIEARGGTADLADILADIVRRDERDMGRADSPLRPASDAHLLDTSEMSIEAAFQAARTVIDAVLAKRNGNQPVSNP
jgi:cytidylate kinase